MRVVSLATKAYLPQVFCLFCSLSGTQKAWSLEIWTDAFESVPEIMRSHRCCSFRSLPRNVDPKRYKLAIFADAIASGDFLFLDADVVVMEDLSELRHIRRLAAAADDLSECDFITDKKFPWPSLPDLSARVYINSGVMWFPEESRPIVEHWAANAADDSVWDRMILPGRLHDNHFICGQMNLHAQEVHLLDAKRWNWQGLRTRGQLNVRRQEASLISLSEPFDRLNLVHFAGVRDVPAFLRSVDSEVGALIARRATGFGMGCELAALGLGDCAPVGQENNPLSVRLARELSFSISSGFRRAGRNFMDSDGMLSEVLSVPPLDYSYESLQVGGAYLDGEEYATIQDWIRQIGRCHVLEIGAGETTILMKRLGAEIASLEVMEGPWTQRAREQGAAVFVAPIETDTGFFAGEAFTAALAQLGGMVDLVFVDSPVGTESRRRVIEALCERIQPRYWMLHDVRRDCPNVFALAARRDLVVLGYLGSARGLILLGPSQGGGRVQSPPTAPHALMETRVCIQVGGVWRKVNGTLATREVEIHNLGPGTLSSDVSAPVHLSYHGYGEDGSVVQFDGLRTRLPCRIGPGSFVTMQAHVELKSGVRSIRFDLVQEGVRWFAQETQSVALPSGNTPNSE